MARKIPRRGDRRRPDDVIALADRRGLRQAISSPMPAGGIGHSSLGPNQGLLPNVQPSSASLALTGGAMNNATGRPYPQMPTVSDTRPNLNVYGATGTAIFGGIITSEEYHPDFFWRDAVKIYEQMLRGDGMVNGLRLALEQPLKAATWSIVPASNDPVDVEIASFVESCLFHDMQYQTADGATLRQTWDYTLHHILMHLWYGFSALEQVWRVEDGLVKWARWTPLLPRTVWRWWVGPDNELAGIQQWTFRDYTYQFINIPAGKLLLFVHRQEGNNYEGVSLLRTAYKHWWYVQNFEKIEAVGLERNAFAIPVVYLPNPFTASDLSYAQTVAQNIRVNELAGVTLPGPKGHPEGFELDYPHQAGRGMPQVQPSVQYHLTQMARNVLATWIMNGSQENGTRAMDGSQRSGFLDALQGTASYIEDVLNQQAIRRLVDYNYVDVGVYPQVRCSRLRAQDLDALSSALQALGPQGGNFLTPTPETEDMLRKQLGLPSAPLSQVESTNPAYQPLDGGTAGESGDEATADENEGGYQQATDAQNQQQDQEPRMAPGDQSPAAGSAAALVELRTEAMLLREALDAAYGRDAVERGTVRLSGGHEPGYTQNRDSHGHWAPGEGEQSGGGAGGDGGRQRAQAEADREAGRGGGGGGSAAGGHNPKPRNAKAATARAKGKTEAEAKGDGGKSEHSYPERTQEIASKLRAREVDPHAPVDVHYVRAALGDSHLAEHLGNFDVATLRESATYHGLSKTGSKAALIDRLVQHATSVTPDESVRIANANVEKHGGDNNRGTSFHIQRDEAGHLLNRSAEVTSVATAAGGHNPKPRNAKAAGAATARSKGKAEAEGGARGGEKAATKPAAAKGEARSEGKAEAEGIHDRSARLQREGGLRAEAKPGVPLTPLRDIGDEGIDPYAKLDPGKLAHIYGEHQLGAALTVYSTTKLREAAKQAGMEKLPGKAHSEMVSNLVAHVTRGRYSANFPELRQAEAEVAAKKAAAKAERAANPKAPRQAKAKAADAKDERPVLRARPLTADQIKGFTGEDATGQDATGEARINPYAKPNAYHIHALYGGEQLHAALGVYSMSHLREMANIVHDRLNEQGVAHTKPTGKTRDQLAKSLADTVIAHPQAPFFAGEYGDGGYGEGMHGAATHSAKEQQKQPLGEGDKRHFAKPAGEVTPGKD